MWVFLATELLLFGGLFTAYAVYRAAFGPAFETAAGHLHLWLGTSNTALLLTSSLTMALAVLASRARSSGWLLVLLAATAALGTVFLGIKGYEWLLEYREGLMPLAPMGFSLEAANPEHGQMFFNLYFVMTGLHAVHLTIAVMVVLVMFGIAWRRPDPARFELKVEITGLYWHLVDVIWIFLFPLFYLVNPDG